MRKHSARQRRALILQEKIRFYTMGRGLFTFGLLVLPALPSITAFSPAGAKIVGKLAQRAPLEAVGLFKHHHWSNVEKEDTREWVPLSSSSTSRSQFLSTALGAFLAFYGSSMKAQAFDGGVGGLGKTKPETGVQMFSDVSAPVQNAAGIVSAELNIQGQPVLVTFQTPWPLLPTTGGLEARDLQQPESAFVQVVTENIPNERPLTKQSMKKLLMTSVFNAQGKFSAYGQPIDIKVKGTDDPSVFAVSFTSFTPGMRESERQTLIKYCSVGTSIILLVTGTTSLRYKKQEATLQKVADSFNAVAAPTSRLR